MFIIKLVNSVFFSGGPCKADDYHCGNGRCIRLSNVCDGKCDCGYSCDDENTCGKYILNTTLSSQSVNKWYWVIICLFLLIQRPSSMIWSLRVSLSIFLYFDHIITKKFDLNGTKIYKMFFCYWMNISSNLFKHKDIQNRYQVGKFLCYLCLTLRNKFRFLTKAYSHKTITQMDALL